MRFFILLVSLFLSACAMTPPPVVDVSKADHGPYPFKYRTVLKSYISAQLVDPYSAVFRFPDKPYKGYTRSAPIAGGKPNAYGYIVKTCVNAKNRFGGYTGEVCKNYFLDAKGGAYPITPNMFFTEQWYR